MLMRRDHISQERVRLEQFHDFWTLADATQQRKMLGRKFRYDVPNRRWNGLEKGFALPYPLGELREVPHAVRYIR